MATATATGTSGLSHVTAKMTAAGTGTGTGTLSAPVGVYGSGVVINNIAMITGTAAVTVAGGLGVPGVPGVPAGVEGGGGEVGVGGLHIQTDDDEEARHNARLYYAKIERALKATRTP